MKQRKLIIIVLSVLIIGLALFACKKVTQTEYNVDKSSCNGCGACSHVCPSDAIYYDANNKAVIDVTKCTKCGECVAVCPQNAIY